MVTIKEFRSEFGAAGFTQAQTADIFKTLLRTGLIRVQADGSVLSRQAAGRSTAPTTPEAHDGDSKLEAVAELYGDATTPDSPAHAGRRAERVEAAGQLLARRTRTHDEAVVALAGLVRDPRQRATFLRAACAVLNPSGTA